jgi:hypothetical protein
MHPYAADDAEGEGVVFAIGTTTPFGERARRRLREEVA